MEQKKQLALLTRYIKNKKRILHSLSVARHMQKYARYFSIDPDRAYFVGLFHDIGKELSPAEIIEKSNHFLKRKLLPIADYEFKLQEPGLLHGIAGVELLINELHLDDILIMSAIANHTTGGKNLDALSKMAFIIDFCEPLRKHAHSSNVYRFLIKQKNLPRAYYFTYYYLIKDLLKRKKEICPESIAGYNEAVCSYFKSPGS